MLPPLSFQNSTYGIRKNVNEMLHDHAVHQRPDDPSVRVVTPGKHYRRWGCTQERGPLQGHLGNVEATITGWGRRHLRL